MAIDVFTEGITLPFHGATRGKIKKWMQRICSALSLGDPLITCILTGNEYITGINKKYRRKNRPTDVISFAYREDPIPSLNGQKMPLGDIYLSLEKAYDQAAEYGVTFDEELKRLLVHGILHLTGYDHERSKKDASIMKNKEEEILNGL